MAQADYVVANGTGAAVRSDINGQLAAIVSNNSGVTEPATMYAYQWWADTTTGLLKIRNAANNDWVTIGTLADANFGLAELANPTFTGTVTAPTFTASTAINIPLASESTPALFFTGDTNTGIFSPGADQLAVATNGVERVKFGNSEVVFNDAGADVDFRIEGDTEANLLFVDASTDRVGIGTASPGSALQVEGLITGTAVVSSDTDTTAGRLLTTAAGPAQAFRRGNILGAVSESSGVPTGAIIEQGSNANGEFIKYADGTMICTRGVTITPVANTPTEKTESWAATFIAGPRACATTRAVSSALQRPATTSTVSTTEVEVVVIRTNTTATANDVIGLGRWY